MQYNTLQYNTVQFNSIHDSKIAHNVRYKQKHDCFSFPLKVLKRFPEGLQADICLHLNRHLLSTNSLFKAASPGCLRTLSLKLKTTHCPPGDYIIHYGDEIKNLYWIGRGTVEVIQNDTITAILGMQFFA